MFHFSLFSNFDHLSWSQYSHNAPGATILQLQQDIVSLWENTIALQASWVLEFVLAAVYLIYIPLSPICPFLSSSSPLSLGRRSPSSGGRTGPCFQADAW